MTTPNSVKIEVIALIDQDVWSEKLSQGMSEASLGKDIAKQITLSNSGTRLLADLESVTIQRYY